MDEEAMASLIRSTIERSGKPAMTVDAFSLHHSRRMFGSNPAITPKAVGARAAETRTGRLILATLLYDFGSENGDEWGFAANITRWLKLEAESSEQFGPTAPPLASQHIETR